MTPDPASRQPPRIAALARPIVYLLGVTGLGLFLVGRVSPSATAWAAASLHIILGLLAAPILLRFGSNLFHRTSPHLGWTLRLLALSGLLMIALAASGISMTRAQAVYWTHIGLGSVLGLAALALGVVRVRVWVAARRTRPLLSPRLAGMAFFVIAPGAGLVAVNYSSEAYYQQITATNAEQAGYPEFPAGTRTASPAAWKDAPTAESCGQAGCHPSQHKEWQASAHAESGRNPEYVQALSAAVKELGGDGKRWCQGCHEPRAVLTDQPLAPGIGIDCLSCHGVRSTPGPSGNGQCTVEPSSLPLARNRHSAKWLADFLVRVRPLPHIASLEGPSVLRDQACASCHRMSAGLAQNHYRFVRIDDTWSEWQQSGASGQSLHAFPWTKPTGDCISCHYDKDGKGHGFAHLNQSTAPIIKVSIFQSTSPTTSTKPTITLDVVVSNAGSGHGWPAFGEEAWVEIEARDGNGRLRLSQGAPDTVGKPISGTHLLGVGGIDRNGEAITVGTKHRAVTWLGPRERNIAPGSADVARYRIALPATATKWNVTARVWRHRAPARAEEIATASMALSVVSIPALPPESARGAETMYYHIAVVDNQSNSTDRVAYGIGLMRREEWRAARAAFEQVNDPAFGRGAIGVLIGRTHLGEGDLLAARSAFQRAATASDSRDSALAWLGHTHRLMGQYEEALRVLQPLASGHPRDRQTWFDIGRSLFQLGRLDEAIAAYQKVLAIDPDDPSARFNLMLAYRSLRKMTDARREEAIYAVIGEDDPPEKLLDDYRRAHPAEQLESLPGHVHSLRVTTK